MQVTYPSATNSNVQDEVHRAMAQGIPNPFVVDPGARDLVELLPIHEPGNSLVAPAALVSVELDPPCVPTLIWDRDGTTDTSALVADTAWVDIAVSSPITSQLTVDGFHGIEFAACRPATAIAQGISQHPESRPDALLVRSGACTESNGSLDSGDLAGLGRENVLALDAARSPALGS